LVRTVTYHFSNVVLAAAFTYTVYLSTLVICTVAYRLSPFHPLAKYPGPVAAKVTKLWAFRLARTGMPHKCYTALHRKYGDVVRVGKRAAPHLHWARQ
jgi:hypothetical protein